MALSVGVMTTLRMMGESLTVPRRLAVAEPLVNAETLTLALEAPSGVTKTLVVAEFAAVKVRSGVLVLVVGSSKND